MTFHSYAFIFVFLPVVVICFHALNRFSIQVGKYFLILSSCIFYSFAEWKSALVLAASLLFNWGADLLIQKENHKKVWFAVSVIGNIGLLYLFKYFGFTIEILNHFWGRMLLYVS